jgi:curved DNA-binding protein CbpA
MSFKNKFKRWNPDCPPVLEVEAEAGDEEIRDAYVRKVKRYPPDRSPREFERVRDAYEMPRDLEMVSA